MDSKTTIRPPTGNTRGGFSKSIFFTLSLILVFAVFPAAPQSGKKKKLSVENVMDLLSGGVAIPRVVQLVHEHGIDFKVDSRMESAFLDAGADQRLIAVMHGQPMPAPGAPLSVASIETPRPPEVQTPQPPRAVPSKPAPASPPSPHMARLQIRSRPGGVAVYVDQELKGETNSEEGVLEIAPLKPGKHHLRATRQGYQNIEGTVELAAGQVLDTPLYLTKTEAPAPAAPIAPTLPPGKKFAVRHVHRAVAGVGGGACQGWMVVNIGYIRYISSDGTHKYLMNTSEMRDAKPDSGDGAFRIKLDFGRNYQFVAVDDKGRTTSPGPVLAEIRYSMGE